METIHRANRKSVERGKQAVRGEGLVTGLWCRCANLVLNQSSQWQVVKQVGKVFPNICGAVFAKALVVKAVTESKRLFREPLCDSK